MCLYRDVVSNPGTSVEDRIHFKSVEAQSLHVACCGSLDLSAQRDVEIRRLRVVKKSFHFICGRLIWTEKDRRLSSGLEKKNLLKEWYWARTRDKASHDPIPTPLGYRSRRRSVRSNGDGCLRSSDEEDT
ncbi:hypothetical protein TNCV_4498111 [Trichonephila clavipes]|nr:hypothetical protein TNCV_4498111 [Trichonephila clavipes]